MNITCMIKLNVTFNQCLMCLGVESSQQIKLMTNRTIWTNSKFMFSTETMFTKSVPSTMKMTVKGGAAVDPDSGMLQ